MIRFTAHLLRHEGDPAWYSTVEALYRQRLADWLSRQGCEYSWDMDEFTVDDRSWTAINLWAPVPELELVRE
jgi:hypothetical protein